MKPHVNIQALTLYLFLLAGFVVTEHVAWALVAVALVLLGILVRP